MEPQTSSSTITIDASAAEVWTVLADEFVDIAAWSPGVKSSGPNPATPEGVSGSRYGGRVAEIEGLGHTDVRITAYDAEKLTLSYTVEAENIPAFIERVTNTWTLTADGPNSSSLEALVGITVAESMSTNEQANKAVEGMLAAGTGASTNLKTYIESDAYQGGADRG
ncbi:MAG: hypothetical protein ACI9C1_000482 [Candidatus Aldehydirespiratoraceae bacterium]|jgi:uncharacterized protein YndB with AHSA1/START domain